MDSDEGGRGTRDEYAELVEEGVHGVELAVFSEGGVFYGE